MSGAPDLTQAVIGYRAWTVNSEGQLCSAGHAQVPWHEVEEHAVCHTAPYLGVTEHVDHPPAEAPHKDCSCGIYAWHDPHESWTSRYAHYVAQCVYGAIAASGRLEVHHDGFRAQRARVVCLAFDEGWPWRSVKSLEDTAFARRVPLVPLAELVEEARRHGGEVPGDMRPEAPPAQLAVQHGGQLIYRNYVVNASAQIGYGTPYGIAIPTGFVSSASAMYTSPQSYPHGYRSTRSRHDEIADEIRVLRRAIATARPWQHRQKRELEAQIATLRREAGRL